MTTQELAYQFWEDAGKPEGRDLEFWLKAESAESILVPFPYGSEMVGLQPDARMRQALLGSLLLGKILLQDDAATFRCTLFKE